MFLLVAALHGWSRQVVPADYAGQNGLSKN